MGQTRCGETRVRWNDFYDTQTSFNRIPRSSSASYTRRENVRVWRVTYARGAVCCLHQVGQSKSTHIQLVTTGTKRMCKEKLRKKEARIHQSVVKCRDSDGSAPSTYKKSVEHKTHRKKIDNVNQRKLENTDKTLKQQRSIGQTDVDTDIKSTKR